MLYYCFANFIVQSLLEFVNIDDLQLITMLLYDSLNLVID